MAAKKNDRWTGRETRWTGEVQVDREGKERETGGGWVGVGERREAREDGGEKKVALGRTRQKGGRSIQEPRPGLVNTATESLVFLSTAATMGPQETKDERRAIYFGPLFRRSAESGLLGCLACGETRGGARERKRTGGLGSERGSKTPAERVNKRGGNRTPGGGGGGGWVM